MRYPGLVPDVLTTSKSFGGGKSSISAYVAREPVFRKAFDNLADAIVHSTSTTYYGFGEETATAIEAVNIAIEDDYRAGPATSSGSWLRPAPDPEGAPGHGGRRRGCRRAVRHLPRRRPQDPRPGRETGTPRADGRPAFRIKLITCAVVDALYRDHGIYTYYTLNGHNPLVAAPPLVVSPGDVEYFLDSLDATLAKGLPRLLTRFVREKVAPRWPPDRSDREHRDARQHLARFLVRNGYDVVGIDLRPPSLRTCRTTGSPTCGHRGATGQLAGADAVVHCASALPSYPADAIHDVIVGGTRSVLMAGKRAGWAGSCTSPRPPCTGSRASCRRRRIIPGSRWTCTAGRRRGRGVAEKFRADGMCLTIVRPKTFLGPGRMGLFAMLFEWAEEGRNFPVLGTGDVRIQMLAIEDLIAAVATILAAPDDQANDTYNIAAAEFGTLRTDFQAVLDLAGHGKRVVSLPKRPALAALQLLERTRLSPVYGRLLHKLLADSYVSIDKSQDRLGFWPTMSNVDAFCAPMRGGGSPLWMPRGGPATPAGAWRQGALSLAKILF